MKSLTRKGIGPARGAMWWGPDRARAGAIALVETVSVRSDWQTHAQGKHIVTTVRFKVERTLKGQAGQELQLEFLGGTIGGLTMEVDGMPQFQVGDRDVLSRPIAIR